MKAMKRLIPTLSMIVLFAGSFNTLKAGEQDTIVKESLPSVSAAPADSVRVSPKICSCRLMNVQTNTFDSRLVGIFAEKTLEGKQGNNYRLMNEYIRREKIYFSTVFARSVERKELIQSGTDCLHLFNKLKKENPELEMYNILDVDILSLVAKK
jgi:hypothetical protein